MQTQGEHIAGEPLLLIGFIQLELRDKGAFALHTIELALVHQGVDGAANGHACGIKLPAQLRFRRNNISARILPALDAGVDALNDLSKNRLFMGFHLTQPLDQISCLYKIITLYNCF
ncbi:hypothetical protein SDC9_143225 [bioreactor metagenome]|uniref:Uncharacterized protein n=1 Tax=bioreactor metagenome TaxID=1076179 RepID=A0A645E3U0_9ZZZZ